jgi:hypothetical protein
MPAKNKRNQIRKFPEITFFVKHGDELEVFRRQLTMMKERIFIRIHL